MKQALLTVVISSALNAGVFAAPQQFDFQDPKGVNNAVFKLDAPLEAISGSANGISGTVQFDPENPSVGPVGKIVVAANTLHVPNPLMKEHLHGAKWMAVEKYPAIAFEARSLKNVKTTGHETTADVTGAFTLRGVTKEITVPVKLTYLKDRLGARSNGQLQGDLLVLRTTFTVKRTDYDINPEAPQDKVANEIEITLSIAGASPR
jgi:polyisoprenoid-binding protein YceI